VKRLWTAALLVLLVGLAVALPGAAQAQDPGTGASAAKECPGTTATLGQTITCAFVVQNIGDFPAQVTALTETSPSPGGTVSDISCTIAGGTVIDEGGTLPQDTPCVGTFQITVPNNPALCNSFMTDRVDIELLYTNFPQPLTAGAFATHTTAIICPAEISITKDADALSKVGDSVNYHFVLTNDGDAPVNRVSVNDTLLGNISASFPATLAAGASATVDLQRTVQAGDADPLPNTVTAIYSSGSGIFATSDTATASDSTNLFQPSITVTKNCAPDPVDIGQAVLCTIVITNTSSADAPALVVASIPDTLSGNLLDVANPNIVSNNCLLSLASGGSCTIVTRHVVTATDPNPLTNSVTVNYNPTGFPNVITATASDSVVVNQPPPPGGEGCTPGFWKQDQHFDSWTAPFDPTDSFEAVFGVDVTLRSGGQGTITDPTLLDALNATGGGINALARHAVAALLNAASPDVDSGFTVAQVIALVHDAIVSGDVEAAHQLLAAANEQGCPLS
jgi:uncharacterized repeat protein (TIGR01451 family)